MNITKRSFLKASGASIATITLAGQTLTSSALALSDQTSSNNKRQKTSVLKNITHSVSAISKTERLTRIG